jgi:large subunit ribosomal protein L29
MNGRELREKADIELREQLAAYREQQFQSRFRSGQDEVEERGRFGKLRREVARILTVLRERQLGVRGQAPAGGGRAEEK